MEMLAKFSYDNRLSFTRSIKLLGMEPTEDLINKVQHLRAMGKRVTANSIAQVAGLSIRSI